MYIGITRNTGLKVPDDRALKYAMERCRIMRPAFWDETVDSREFDEMLVEWFFSGNWVHEEDGPTSVHAEVRETA